MAIENYLHRQTVNPELIIAACHRAGVGGITPVAKRAKPLTINQARKRFVPLGVGSRTACFDAGELINFEPKSAHPGFPKDVLAYDTRADKWTRLGDSPLSRATAPVVEWRGLAVIPNGETRPGVRTPEVWGLQSQP